MNRRRFLQASAPATVSAAAAAAAAQTVARQASGVPGAGFEWAEAGAADLAQAMAEGRTSALGLVQAYAARIAALDTAGPRLRSVIELNPEAEATAAQLDAERRAGRLRGPLHGIPVLVKDNIATADRMATSAGSPALLGIAPPRDAAVVARLRAAGAVILGKTNLSEWANFRGKNSVSGWSTRGGQTRNPYALDRSPSGSSSGTGAAVAANLAALGVGTETDGSITSPASVQALVGVKPTVGLVSRDGIVPIAFSQDTAGPMCRRVADAALLLHALAGVDPRDPATRTQRGAFDPAALLHLTPNALRGARLGVAMNLVEGHGRGTVAAFEAALDALEGAGATLVRAPLPNLDKMGAGELDVLQFEMRHAMAAYLAEFAAAGPHRSLADLVAYNRAHPETLALFGQEWFELSAAKGALATPAYRTALAQGRRFARTHGIDAMLRKHRLDAIVAPTGGPAWLIDPVNGDSGNGPSATTPAAVAGYPHVTVPMGQVAGLPVGLSFFGTAWRDAQLLALALHFEQATRARTPPALRPSALSV
ncbi:MAG TPA: amidase [Burkholderiaceae bacterium]|nr:amidase [Burkholderiaceae bacterium]